MKKGECFECGISTAALSREEFNQHMVGDHGYKTDGVLVWKPKVCTICGRTANYKVGAAGYCREHLAVAKTIRDVIMTARTKEASQFYADMRKENDGRDLNSRYTRHKARHSVASAKYTGRAA